MEKVEEALVRQALKMTNGNQTKAAKLLDISRDALRYRMQKFGLLKPNLLQNAFADQTESLTSRHLAFQGQFGIVLDSLPHSKSIAEFQSSISISLSLSIPLGEEFADQVRLFTSIHSF